MADEPAYLRKLREDREARARKGREDAPAQSAKNRYTIQEKEALKWAREQAAGADLKTTRDLGGARYVVLLKLASVTGTASLSLEGLPTREALLARLKRGPGMGEELLGAYEVKGGRPITVSMEGGEPVLAMGAARPGANPLPPEKMLRKALADAALREKTRGRDRDGDRGRGGRGR